VVARLVEHVGSTAVSGLAATPVVDIAAPVYSLTDAHDARAGLEQDGWRYWSADPNRSWRLWFLLPRPEARTHHLYPIKHDDPHRKSVAIGRLTWALCDILGECPRGAGLRGS
jgi:GrpB-like predicted nucleotidyltransferase (UPF0157 family)